jgi:hypothetical protein
MFRRRQNGLAGERSSPNIDVSFPLNGKFTLTLDCEWLLKPDTNRPGIHISKIAEEAAEHLQLDSLLSVPILNQVKMKMFHTCGRIEFEEGSCLVTLWGTGDWFVERYRENGKSARYEKLERDTKEDWAEPDATLLLVLD